MRIARTVPSLVAACVVAGLAACTTTPAPAPEPAPPVAQDHNAVVNLASASGSLVSGRLQVMTMGANAVHIAGEVGGLAPNSAHGFHVHETGDCSAADASSAGGHFNPAGTPHGRMDHGAHHAGDMDNIVADAEGVARVNMHVPGLTLGGGGATDIAGRAIIVHADPDDYASQPSGNAGARLACGIITIVD
ncbi:superoxide dismutase family protein [Cognatiluteimonas lumbrici]|uniref:superoxide dismutase family protein n=1 Tax=Cognatiluteimonas lumbrici TaxID=2559601 RepID=UPI001129C20C|nr:superoxide dismutase family protein [Luteimonas lumbrici]